MSDAVATPPRPPIAHPGLSWDEKPSLAIVVDADEPRFTITAHEPCAACEGEGHVMVEVRGGRWNSYIGTWEPDERKEECIECEGAKTYDRIRCVACGRIHEDHDEWGVRPGEEQCECEPEDVLERATRFIQIKKLIRRHVEQYLDAKAKGVSISLGVHSIPWNAWCALVAEEGAKWKFFPATSKRPAFWTADVIADPRYVEYPVPCYTAGPEKGGW